MFIVQMRPILPSHIKPKPWCGLHRQYGDFPNDPDGSTCRFFNEADAKAMVDSHNDESAHSEYRYVEV